MSAIKLPKETERGFQTAVIEAARLKGWRVASFRPARTNKGWRTPVQADGAGWPDLVLVREDRIIFAELKTEKGKLRPEQMEWLTVLNRWANSRDLWRCMVRVWRPSMWPEIMNVLA